LDTDSELLVMTDAGREFQTDALNQCGSLFSASRSFVTLQCGDIYIYRVSWFHICSEHRRCNKRKKSNKSVDKRVCYEKI